MRGRWVRCGWLISSVVAIVACSPAATGCPGGSVGDPGVARPADLFGPVAATVTNGPLEVAGTVVQAKGYGVQGECAPTRCYAYVRLEPDRSTASEISYLNADAQGRIPVNVTSFRFEGMRLVLYGGRVFNVSDRLTIEGCGGSDRSHLEHARFGATFFIDATSMTVVHVECNGCA